MKKQLSLIVEEKEGRSMNWKLLALRCLPILLAATAIAFGYILNGVSLRIDL
jgi:hypothetical protein